ncbi:MAG: hypothetical protein Q8P31_00475 [Bacillota bacterium]|nr:hypothetical protein [Bacillota bacterium]
MGVSRLGPAALGEHILARFVDAKRIEADVYRTQVHQWELEQYLAVFWSKLGAQSYYASMEVRGWTDRSRM